MKKNHNRRTAAAAARRNGDMPSEIDFSGGARGKFYRRNAKLNLPVYLDADIQAYLTAIAARKGVALSELSNEILRKEIGIIETAR